jgi:NTP pyrophosphatase (non-canonical NTP hydrolase)
MDIENIIKEHYSMMVEKGFHNIKERGITKNQHTGELIALLIGELCGEALEAHRRERFCKVDNLKFDMNYQEDSPIKSEIGRFEVWVKDTFEDEIADVFLRLFDLCGFLQINPVLPSTVLLPEIKNMGEAIFLITRTISDTDYSKLSLLSMISDSIEMLQYLCSDLDIPIEKHIAAKMAYNKTRPHKNGKAY